MGQSVTYAVRGQSIEWKRDQVIIYKLHKTTIYITDNGFDQCFVMMCTGESRPVDPVNEQAYWPVIFDSIIS